VHTRKYHNTESTSGIPPKVWRRPTPENPPNDSMSANQPLLQEDNARALLQQNPGIIEASDHHLFPPDLFMAGKQRIPLEVMTWAQLKQWSSQNAGVVPVPDMDKVLLYQTMQFQSRLRKSVGLNSPLDQQMSPVGFAQGDINVTALSKGKAQTNSSRPAYRLSLFTTSLSAF